jgi:hypothetical protein
LKATRRAPDAGGKLDGRARCIPMMFQRRDGRKVFIALDGGNTICQPWSFRLSAPGTPGIRRCAGAMPARYERCLPGIAPA